MARRMAKTLDKAMLLGDGTGAGTTSGQIAALVKGLASYDPVSGNVGGTLDISNADKFTVAKAMAARKALGAWGLNPSELVLFVSTQAYYELLEDTNFLTVDKAGPAATLLTGQVGSVGNTPVVVSASFDGVVAGNAAAVIVNAMNFLAGTHRGMRVDSDDIIAEQRSILVASMRIGMTQLSTADGQGVATVRYVA